VVLNKKIKITCPDGKTCDPFELHYESWANSEEYHFSLDVIGSEPLIGVTKFYLKVFNDSFSAFVTWMRIAYSALTVLLLVVFAIIMKATNMTEWTREQQALAIVAVALVFFNNPFYVLAIHLNGWFGGFINILFTVTFYFLLLFFILTMVDENELFQISFKTYYLPKIVIVVYWLLILISKSLREFDKERNPYHFFENIAPFILELIVYQSINIYIIYVAFKMWMNVNYKGEAIIPKIRYSIFISLLAFLLINIGSITDSFFHPHYGAEFMFFQSLCNCFVYLLLFFYSPSTQTQAVVQRFFDLAGLGGGEEAKVETFENKPQDKTTGPKQPQQEPTKPNENLTDEGKIKIIESMHTQLEEEDTESD